MSLIVSVYSISDEGEMKLLNLPSKCFHNELFGFESWRYAVWGSAVVSSIGCVLLGDLKGSDLYLEKGDVLRLRNELYLVNNHIRHVSERCEVSVEALRFRVWNGILATKIAVKLLNGGVYIG